MDQYVQYLNMHFILSAIGGFFGFFIFLAFFYAVLLQRMKFTLYSPESLQSPLVKIQTTEIHITSGRYGGSFYHVPAKMIDKSPP